MTPLALSITGVELAVFGQSQFGLRAGLLVLGKFFCQKTLPESVSNANSVSSAPSRNSKIFTPCAVLTPDTTTGGLRVASATGVGLVESSVLHTTASFETLSLLNVVSPRFQPVRSGSYPYVSQSS